MERNVQYGKKGNREEKEATDTAEGANSLIKICV